MTSRLQVERSGQLSYKGKLVLRYPTSSVYQCGGMWRIPLRCTSGGVTRRGTGCQPDRDSLREADRRPVRRTRTDATADRSPVVSSSTPSC